MRVFTILGPSHSGKTTLVEALAGLEGRPGNRFEVAGVAAATTFEFMGDEWAALDFAGGAENLAQVGPALAASDAAILCVPADAEAAVLAAPSLRLIEASGIPCILFINRIDAATDRVADIVSELQAYARHNVVLRQVPMRDGDQITGAVDLISERAWKYHEGEPSTLIELPEAIHDREQEARSELLESLSDFDDTLLEQLIEDKQPMTDDVFGVAAQTLRDHALIPALLGSGLHRNGVMRLMKILRHEAPGVEVAAERLSTIGQIRATGCLADHVKHLGKTVLLRAVAGDVASGDKLGGDTIGSLTALDGKTPLPKIESGGVGLAVKSDHLSIGFAYSEDASLPLPSWAHPKPSGYRRIVATESDRDEARLSPALERLSEIDPILNVEQDEVSGHAILATQGPLHMRRLIEKLDESFGIKLTEEPVPPALRETIQRRVEHHHRHRKQSGGAGQFADVVIEIRPEPRGSGFRFEETVKGGAVPRNYIPAVQHGAEDALQAGPAGFPVVDVSVHLKDGKHHSVDSSDFAFRTAGKNAVKEAIDQAGAIVLQPIMKVEIHVPTTFTGALVPIVSGLKGQVLGFDNNPDAPGWDIFNTLLPMTSLDELFNSLASATRGTGWFAAEFDHYEEARKEALAAAMA